MRPTTIIITAGVLLQLPVAPLAAQTWQRLGVPDNSNAGAYWNNRSDDNAGAAACNVGAILTNAGALTAASCAGQRPTGVLPLVPAPLGVGSVFLGSLAGAPPIGGFRFAAGSYAFTEVARVAGDAGTQWGVITDGGTVFTSAALRSLGGAALLTQPFAIWITQALPVAGAGSVYSSAMTIGTATRLMTINQQFAVFTTAGGAVTSLLRSDAFGTVISPTGATDYWIGMEDNVNGGRSFESGARPDAPRSDRDYNDIIIRVSTVPEPSAVWLLGGGLLLAAAARSDRRRSDAG